MGTTSGTDPAAVSLPGGGGLTSGLGESLRLDLNSGQSVYSVPLKLPRGVADLTPTLRLEYVAAAPNGPFGLGWRIPFRAIRRRLDAGVPDGSLEGRFHDDDLEIRELADGSYAPLVETAFNRYERVGDGWVIMERSGIRHELGTDDSSRVTDPDHPDRVVAWLLRRTTDTSDNEITYHYTTPATSTGVRLPDRIEYAGFVVEFDHEDRPDPIRDGRAGFLRLTRQRCSRITVSHVEPGGPRPIRSWQLGYRVDPVGGASQLASVVGAGHGAGGTVELPPVTFRYREFDPDDVTTSIVDELAAGPPSLADPDTTLVPLDDVALPGVLQVRDGVHTYWPNLDGATLGPPRIQRDVPNVTALGRAGAQLLDVDGNGTPDMVVGVGAGRLSGYYRNDGARGWGSFVPAPRGGGAEPTWAGGARPVDLDGDGVVDAIAPLGRSVAQWTNLGPGGWSTPTVRHSPVTENDRPLDLTDPMVRLADMTGDGLLDLVEIRSGGVRYWPSLGHGRFADAVLMDHSPRLPHASDDPTSVLLADLSGDGCADLVRVADGELQVWPNRQGTGFGVPSAPRRVPPVLTGSLRIADLGGEGRAMLVWSTLRSRTNPLATARVGEPFAGRLVEIDNGQGLVSTLGYGSSIGEALRDREEGESWSGALPFPVVVVTSTTETDAVSGRTTTVRYRYHDGHFDPVIRQFQGFARVEQIEVGDASRPDRTTVHHFVVGDGNPSLNRLLRRVEVLGPGDDGHPVVHRVEETEHDTTPLAPTAAGVERRAVFARRVVVSRPEGTVDDRVEERTYEYDGFGNVTSETTRFTGTRGGQPLGPAGWSIATEYAHRDDRHIHDRVLRTVRRNLAGDLLAEIRMYYDGAAFVGLPAGQLDRGLLTRREQLVLLQPEFDAHYGPTTPASLGYAAGTTVDGDDGQFAQVERHEYDARGLTVADMDETGTVTRRVFDADGLFPVRKQGPLGETVLDYDIGSGEPTRVADADGTEVLMRYDGLGRLTAAVLPGDTLAEPTRSYRYDTDAVPCSVDARYRRSATETMRLVAYHDGAGSEVQRRVEHGAGRVVVSPWTVPNPFGDAVDEFEPTFGADFDFAIPPLAGRPHRSFRYDVEGRAIRTTNYNGSVSTVAISPYRLEIRDAVHAATGVARVEELDVLRRRVAVHEPTDAGTLTTRYDIGDLGELLAITDDAGVIVGYTYDRLGHRLAVEHREAGRRQMFVDASGRVVRTIDGEDDEITAAFDALGRISTLRVNGAVTERYDYDPAHPGGLGRLAGVSYPGGEQRFEYTPRGQVRRRVQTVDGRPGDLAVEYEYDGLGNETSIRHPDGTVVATEYHTNGWVRAVPGYVDEVMYDPRGLSTEVRFANGVVTSTTHTDGIGRVASMRTVGPGGAGGSVLDDVTYAFDALDRVASVTDARTGTTTAMEYDLLHQLASVDDGTDRTEYDYAGRDLTRNGDIDAVLGYDDPVRPGRLTGVAVDGGAVETVTSDGNGSIVALRGRTLAYDAKGQLAQVTSGSTTVTYGYDHRGERCTKRVDDGGTITDTVFVGDRTEVRGAQTVAHVSIGSWRIAIRTSAVTRWIHTDHLGSGRFFTTEAGQRVDGITMRPFGNVVGPGSAVSPRVFALHPYDTETGLYYARRRYYSPEIGRWTSPDGLYLQRPETDDADPRTMALYTYVANDPANYVDPVGRSFWTVLGGIVGVIVGVVLGALVVAAFASGIGFGILALVGVIALVAVGYVGAASVDPTSAGGQFLQGLLIGVNAGLNAVLATAVFGPVIGVALGVINFLAVFDDVRQNAVYQGILGWSNFVQPMSWLITGLGLIMFTLNLIGHVLYWISGKNWTFFQVQGFEVDWATGTFGTRGGWISNLNAWDTAFNMGNFVFVDQNSTGGVDTFRHEIGHTLNLAVFGSAFHLAGWIDEIAVNGGNALSEQMAEDHVPGTGRAHLADWWI